MTKERSRLAGVVLLALAACGPLAASAQEVRPDPVVVETRGPDGIVWQPLIEADGWLLRLAGPGGVHQWFGEETVPSFDLIDSQGELLPDGVYSYELIPSLREDESRADEMLGARTGNFRVQGGVIVLETVGDPGPTTVVEGEGPSTDPLAEVDGLRIKRSADTALSDDYCIGNGCSTIGSFPALSSSTGYLKLKGSATGIIFSDTSVSGTNHDWQLAANDGTGNLSSFFAIYDNGTSGDSGVFDSSGATAPLFIEQGAGSNALRIQGVTGNVGLGTLAPAQELDIAGFDPSLRFSDTSGREWTVNFNANSANFDLVSTESGLAPVRHLNVHRDAPPDQLMLTSTGIGIGTSSPNATVEIRGNSGTSQMAVTEEGADAAVEVMLNLICNCAPAFRLTNTTNGQVWFFRHLSGGDFSFDDPSAAGQEMRLTSTGNLFLKGSLSQGSSRALKENLVPANGESVLSELAGLDLYEWSYIDQSARHFGPMAEDFAEAYGLGQSKAKIAPADMAGLSLAASKTLMEKNQSLETRVGELESQLKLLVGLVEELRRD